MKLSNLITTIDSQIPIVALEVLSPEEATIIQWLTTEVMDKLNSPVYFWNLGVSSLEPTFRTLNCHISKKPSE